MFVTGKEADKRVGAMNCRDQFMRFTNEPAPRDVSKSIEGNNWGSQVIENAEEEDEVERAQHVRAYVFV
jgi:hypothetical protein